MSEDASQQALVQLTTYLVCGGVVLVGFIAGSVLLLRAVLRSNKAFSERERARVAAEMPRWELAMQRWNRSYYCELHDLILDPEDHASAPADQLISFLYR